MTHLGEENRVNSVLLLLYLKQICGLHHVYFIESDGIYRMDRRRSKKYKYRHTSLVLIFEISTFETGISSIEIKRLNVTSLSMNLNQS